MTPPSGINLKWTRACSVSDIDDDEGLKIDTVPPVSVFKSEDEYFCIDDTCTHDTYSLAEGWVEECVVECALHQAKFNLRTGSGGPPATSAVRVHEVKVEGDDILISLPDTYVVKD